MNKKITFTLVAAAFAATFSSANLLSDGGFENPVVSAGGFTNFAGGSSVGAWTAVGDRVLLHSNTYDEVPTIVFGVQEGVQALDLTGPGNTSFANGVFQNVATTVGLEYNLSYWVGRAQGQVNDARYQTPAIARVLIDGALLTTSTNASSYAAGTVGWQKFTTSFVANSALTRVEFLNGVDPAGGASTNYSGIDDVQLEAVPEPATMVVLGLAGAALARRRRR